MRLSGLNAIITGASQGLGKAIAAQFLREGASVALCARDATLLASARDELAAAGGRVVAQACDVSDERQVAQFTAFAVRELGSVHALVSNAGVYGPMGPTDEVDLGEWQRAVEINLYGTLLPCRALLPHFKQAGRGEDHHHLGRRGDQSAPEYQRLCRVESGGRAPHGNPGRGTPPLPIDVNAVAPGALKTRLIEQVLAAGPEKVGAAFFAKNKTWAEEGATPLELGAELCACLASAESDGITGKLISAQWDPWRRLSEHRDELAASDIYCLRRIVPEDRGKKWS
ncbi:MAG: SDR family NAD(P)-dependent oxidoreductase [Chthoniobacter sp.]